MLSIRSWKSIPLYALACVVPCLPLACSTEKTQATSTAADFCSTLEKDNMETAMRCINAYLETGEPEAIRQDNYIAVADWLMKQSCVTSAAISKGELDADPPIKIITLTIRTPSGSDIKKVMLLSATPENPRITSIQ